MTGIGVGAVQPDNVGSLARIHRDAFPGFQCQLGEPPLVPFYDGFLEEESAVIVAASTADGLVVGAAEPHGCCPLRPRRRWQQFGLEAARHVPRSPASALRLVRAVRSRGGHDEAGALLSSSGVAPSARGAGLGRQLLAERTFAVRRAGIERAFLTTDAEGNNGADRFYRQERWTLSATFHEPEGRIMDRSSRTLVHQS